MPMKPYVIKQGDYLLKLSHTLGFNHDKVWSDGKNAKLKELRKNPNMLQAGDIVFPVPISLSTKPCGFASWNSTVRR